MTLFTLCLRYLTKIWLLLKCRLLKRDVRHIIWLFLSHSFQSVSLSFYFSVSLAQGHRAPAFLSLSSGCVYGWAADKEKKYPALPFPSTFCLWPVQRAGWGIWGLLKGGNGDGVCFWQTTHSLTLHRGVNCAVCSLSCWTYLSRHVLYRVDRDSKHVRSLKHYWVINPLFILKHIIQ